MGIFHIFKKNKLVSFESQLETFKKLGFKINPGIDLDIVVENLGGKIVFEKLPYFKMYLMLGSTDEGCKSNPYEILFSKNDSPEDIFKKIAERMHLETPKDKLTEEDNLKLKETPITDQLWYFDTKSIENHGDYIRILNNLKRITGKQMYFKNIKDFVDIENNTAWISFDLFEKHFKWNLKVNNNWVDADLFSQIVKLTYQFKTIKKLTYFSDKGQGFVLGWADQKLFNKLRKQTGLNIEWLN